MIQFKRRVVVVIVSLGLFLNGSAQMPDPPRFADDRVAAMLDSLARNTYLSRLPRHPSQANNKFHYAADSVPRPDAIVVEARLARLNTQSPFDLVYNNDVQAYINLYAVRKRASVERMMGLAQLYYPIFEQQLDKYNLPLELKHLAVIESALNPTATSRSGARGLWQFMYTTGKMYGLDVTSYVDERCDPYKSTVAACEYLKALYSMFGDWQMVLAAYNSGPGTVNKAIRRAGGGRKSYWDIRPYLPLETQGYVPAFIAANYVMNFSAEHNLFSATPRRVFFDVDTIALHHQVTFQQIEALLNVPTDELLFLNPMYKLGVVPVSLEEPYQLVLPANKVGNFLANEDAIYAYIKKDTLAPVTVVQQVKQIHTVRRGEHISSIARRYKCTAADIRNWNKLRSNTLRTGQKLVIYTLVKTPAPQAPDLAETQTPEQQLASTTPAAETQRVAKTESTKTTYKYYTVKKGDTLSKIAQSNGTSVQAITKLNNISVKHKLIVGEKLKIGK
jgi:membrane-bound lytic murein transglycosylase D